MKAAVSELRNIGAVFCFTTKAALLPSTETVCCGGKR